jgi:hypothetical protein
MTQDNPTGQDQSDQQQAQTPEGEAPEAQAPEAEAQQTPAPEQVICPPNKESVVRYVIIAVILIGISAWCIYDWPNYPKPDEPLSSETLNGYAGWAFNHFLPFVLIPVGLIFVAKALKTRRTEVQADQEGISAGATRIAWADVEKLDASRLKDKQILDLHHSDGVLRLRGLNLANFKALVALIDQKIPEDKKVVQR